VVVRMDGGPVYLHLLVFAGAIAQDEAADQVMSRLGSRPSRPGPTIEIGKLELPKTDPEPKAADPKSSEPRILVWELSEEEREWLAGIVAGFEGGEFKSALENAPRSSPGLARITRYLASTRPTQYAGRLYEHPTNQLLRQRTVELLVDRPDLDAHLERLPTAIRRALDGLLS